MGVQMREDRMGLLEISIDVASVATITTAEQTFSVVGLLPGDFVAVNKSTHNAGLGVCNARVSAVDTLALTFVNPTAGAVDPAAMKYLVFFYRPEIPPPPTATYGL